MSSGSTQAWEPLSLYSTSVLQQSERPAGVCTGQEPERLQTPFSSIQTSCISRKASVWSIIMPVSAPESHTVIYHETNNHKLKFDNVAADDQSREQLELLEKDWTTNEQNHSESHGASSATPFSLSKSSWLLSAVRALGPSVNLSIRCLVIAEIMKADLQPSEEYRAECEEGGMQQKVNAFDWKKPFIEWLQEKEGRYEKPDSEKPDSESTALELFHLMLSDKLGSTMCDEEAGESYDVYLTKQRLIG